MMLPSVYKTLSDLLDHSDTTLRPMLKKAGYSHFRHSNYDGSGSVINIQKGVKIEWHICNEFMKGKRYYRLVDVLVRKKRSIKEAVKVKGSWETHDSSKTEFVKVKSFRCDDLPVDESAAESLFKEAMAEAAKHTGDAPVTKNSLAKGLIQNVIMQDIKAKLESQFKGMFNTPAYQADFGVNSTIAAITFKINPATVGPEAATLTVRMPHTDQLSHVMPELTIRLGDGELIVAINYQFSKAIAIPSFADPSFDNDALLRNLTTVIHHMRDAADYCYKSRKTINEIEDQIRVKHASFIDVAEETMLACFQ